MDKGELSPTKRTLLQMRLHGGHPHAPRNSASGSAPPYSGPEPRPPGAQAPLSFAQARLLGRMRTEEASSRNHFFLLELRGNLDIDAVRRAGTAMVERHENLRTTFAPGEPEPRPVVSPDPCFDFDVTDLSAAPDEDRIAQAIQRGTADGRIPYDLERGPLLRVRVYRLGEDHHVLLLAISLVVFDVWSMGVAVREMAILYNAFVQGGRPPLPPLPLQYGDFAYWQRHIFAKTLNPQLDYWKAALAGGLPRIGLPERKAPIHEDRPFAEAMIDIKLRPGLTAAVASFGRRHGATPFMILLSAFDVLLAKLSGVAAVATGTPIANRHHPGTEGLIGYFPNVLPTRVDLSGDPTFLEVVERVRRVLAGAYAHQDVPFDRYRDILLPAPQPAVMTPILFSVQNTPIPPLSLNGLDMRPLLLDYGVMSPFDLTLLLIESDVLVDGSGETAGMLHYNQNLYEESAVQRLWSAYQDSLAELVARPEHRISELASGVTT